MGVTTTAVDQEDSTAQTPAAPTDAGDESPVGVGSALRTVSGLTLASRLTGLARDALCSRVFGAGPIWSAFAFAFLIPNLFRRLFGEGALAAAFLPEYARLRDADAREARIYAGVTVRLVLVGLGVSTLLGEAVVVGLLMTPLAQSGALAMRLMLATLPFMPMVCATAILGAMLQSRGKFAMPAAAPIVVNLCILAAAAIWTFGLHATDESAIVFVAVAVPIAGAIQLGWALWILGGDRPALGARTRSVRPVIHRTLRRMAPVAIGMSAMQINTLIDGLIASWPVLFGPDLPLRIGGHAVRYPLDGAANATLFFAQRLYHFPLGVFGIALATAVFPALARSADNPARFTQTLRRGVRLSLFIGIPASIGLALVRQPLVSVIYLGGEFTGESVARVARVLLGYAPGVWAFGLVHVLTRAFYARGDTRTPMRIALIAIGANTALNLVLIWPMQEAALAWSTSICAIGQAWALSRIAHRRLQPSVGRSAGGGRSGRRPLLGVLIASAVSGAAVLAADVGLRRVLSDGWSGSLGRLTALVGVGVVAFIAVGWRTNREEIGWLLERGGPAGADDQHAGRD